VNVFGAVVAGGRSVRYGSPKAIAEVGGRRIIDRVVTTLRIVTPEVVLLSADPVVIEAAGVPTRPDALPGLGALGGIHAGLLWAREAGRRGILAVACDMPFLSRDLLNEMLERAARSDADAVVPESGSRRGIEPLCAYYAVTCIEPIEDAANNDDRRLIGFHARVVVQRIPLAEVERFGPPARLFLNVNTPEERDAAERLAGDEV
jgi:molybdopterin-guanine dinucleotide biosynthesis protein A